MVLTRIPSYIIIWGEDYSSVPTEKCLCCPWSWVIFVSPLWPLVEAKHLSACDVTPGRVYWNKEKLDLLKKKISIIKSTSWAHTYTDRHAQVHTHTQTEHLEAIKCNLYHRTCNFQSAPVLKPLCPPPTPVCNEKLMLNTLMLNTHHTKLGHSHEYVYLLMAEVNICVL